MNSKRVSQIFKILFRTGDINIFVPRGVLLSRKTLFLMKKTSPVKSETHCSRETIEN